jgi:hypothetical protein
LNLVEFGSREWPVGQRLSGEKGDYFVAREGENVEKASGLGASASPGFHRGRAHNKAEVFQSDPRDGEGVGFVVQAADCDAARAVRHHPTIA